MSDQRRRIVHTKADVDELRHVVLSSAKVAVEELRANIEEPIALMHTLRFGKVGRCPIKATSLNFVEQLNQTFTILTSLCATELLLDWHPDAEGFQLALGTCPGSDIQSLVPGVVVAETFAATHHGSNKKLVNELKKLASISDVAHRYVFFSSPSYEVGRHEALERFGVEVHVTRL